MMTRLSTETIESTTLTLEGVDNIEGGDGLALGVFCVGDGVTDDTLEEGLQDATGLLVDHCINALQQGLKIAMMWGGRAYWLRYA